MITDYIKEWAERGCEVDMKTILMTSLTYILAVWGGYIHVIVYDPLGYTFIIHA